MSGIHRLKNFLWDTYWLLGSNCHILILSCHHIETEQTLCVHAHWCIEYLVPNKDKLLCGVQPRYCSRLHFSKQFFWKQLSSHLILRDPTIIVWYYSVAPLYSVQVYSNDVFLRYVETVETVWDVSSIINLVNHLYNKIQVLHQQVRGWGSPSWNWSSSRRLHLPGLAFDFSLALRFD